MKVTTRFVGPTVRIVSAFLLPGLMLAGLVSAQAAGVYQEVSGLLVLEAEGYHSKANTSARDWYTFPATGTPTPDPDGPHATGTGNGQYVEILPDSRVTHDDPLENGVNFFATGVGAPRLNYQVRITSPGRYYARIRAFSTGTEDNGVHLGVNDTWPLSGTAVQWCDGKNQWTWSGARRVPENHCGITNGIYLDLTAGDHTLMMGMREDGFEMDRLLLTMDPDYFPTGVGPAASPTDSDPPPPQGTTFSFQPTDDAYLQGTTRYNDNFLKVEAGKRVSYLKFVVSGLSGTVRSATLKLQENGDLGSGTLRVHRGSHNNWTETTLTTANAPAENGQLGIFTGAVAAAQVVSVDITPMVTGNGTYSVIVKQDAGSNDVWFGSRASTRKPELVIETTGGATPTTYALTVNSGTGSGNYAPGASVNIVAAAAPAGQVFDRWTGDIANIADVTAASTTITMPAADAIVAATYIVVPTYALTIQSGSGSGSYLPDTVVGIVANSPSSGQVFDRWTGDIANIANVTAASTSITMPAADAIVTATYIVVPTYALTIQSGSGSGSYLPGTVVGIVANSPSSGQVFDRWTGDIANIADVTAASTSITMPAADAVVTATYQAATSSTTFNFQPTDDAYLQGKTLYNDNFLKVEAGKRVSYLKFAVSGLAGTVRSATLKLQENGDIGSGTLRVHRGSHNNWTETTLTTANAPAENGQLGIFTGAIATAQVVSVDITPMVTGNGTYSVIVKQDAGGNDVWFGSRASTRKPELVIETTGGATPTTYALTVNSGTGSGNYTAGTIMNIVAAAPPAGQVFDRWTGDIANIANVNAASTSITMPAAAVTVMATYQSTGSVGIGGIGPIDGITATGNAGLITSISGNPVSELLLGTTTFPNPPWTQAFPANHADNFDLNLLGSGDTQPYIDVRFGQAVMGIFLIENNGNDSGFMQGLDATGNPIGPVVPFTTSDYLKTVYRTGNNQIASGLFVWMQGSVFGLRILPPNGALIEFDPVSVSALLEPQAPDGNGIGGIGPIDGMTATGNAGMITSISGIPVSELALGTTVFPNPAKFSTAPASYADNFNLNLVGSGDDQPYIDVRFGQEVMGIFLIENHGNDSGFMQGLNAAGDPVGPLVAFSTSHYLQTAYRTQNNQIASGLFVWTKGSVFGLRITPPNGGVMGFDPVSVSALLEEASEPEASLAVLTDFSEVWNGQTLVWEKALFSDPSVAGSSGIPFGLARPADYTAGGGQQYPLVIYLHGADARGNNDNKNLVRQTARFFAHQARTDPLFNAFVLSPQVPALLSFVNVDFNNGPYQQSAATLTHSMQLTENLVRYLTDPAHQASLTAALGFRADEVDISRLYVVGDSMGAYGTWDMLGRGAIPYAAAIASAGSGPANRLAQIQQTPLWVLHGETDSVVPNYLPHLDDADGAGSVGMLGLIDPTFDNSASTSLIRLDNYASTADDPTPAHTLVYSQYPGHFDHVNVAAEWTGSMVSDFSLWLFGQSTAGPLPGLQRISILPPHLEMTWDSTSESLLIIWPGERWVLQEAWSLDAAWIDVEPLASSPYPVAPDGDHRYFRLRAADDTGMDASRR